MVKPVGTTNGTQPGLARPVAAPPAGKATQPIADSLHTGPDSVTVVQGDTLSSLAARHGITLDQLRQLNPQLFQEGPDSQGHKRGGDGRLIYQGDVVRLRPAAVTTQAATPSQVSAAGDRVVEAAKAFIDAASQSGDAGANAQARQMLDLIPANDPERKAYEAKVQAVAAQPAAPNGPGTAGAASSDLAAAQDYLAQAQDRFAEASDGYDAALKASHGLDEMARAIAAHQAKALAAYQDALKAGAVLGAAAQPALDAMAERLRQMGVTDKALAEAKAAAPAPGTQLGKDPAAGGPAAPAATALPVGPLPAAGPAGNVPASVTPATTPQPTNPADQFSYQERLCEKAMERFGELRAAGNDAGAEAARADAMNAYRAMTMLLGQFDPATRRSFEKTVNNVEDFLQYYKIASIVDMDVIRKQAKLDPSPTTAWAPANRAAASASASAPSMQQALSHDPNSDALNDPNAQKVRDQLAQMLPRMNAGQVEKLPADTIDVASFQQRAQMIKVLLDHWSVSSDAKKKAADIIEATSRVGKLDGTLKALGAAGIAKVFDKLSGEDRIRAVKAMFWEFSASDPMSPAVLGEVARHMDKDDVRAVMEAYGQDKTSQWFKDLPPDIKAAWAKILGAGWFGHSSQDKVFIESLKAAN